MAVGRAESAPTGASIPEFFRAVNERIRELGWHESSQYELVCECDDPGCARMLRMQPWEYEALRSDVTLFAVLPGHERAGGVELLVRTDRFVIVRMRARLH
jgi:hypothetical protein